MPPKGTKRKAKKEEAEAEAGAEAPTERKTRGGGKKAKKEAEKPAKEEKKEEVKAEEEQENPVSTDSTGAQWWEEPICAGMFIKAKLKPGFEVQSFKSKFQDVKVFESETLGKVLALDGYSQSAQRDEFIYHESLAHPALFAHANPKTVFIGGGGELATAREVLRHKSVERLVMVDIDEEVVQICRKLLPEWGAAEVDADPRCECVYDDAKKYLEETKDKFDVVIMDIADPIAAGPGIALYFTDFYKNLKNKLNPGFVFVTQSGPCGVWTHKECFSTINRTLRESFDNVFPYSSFLPAFADYWGFNLAFDNHSSLDKDLTNINPADLDKKIKQRLKKNIELQHYDGIGHRNMFSVPKYVRQGVAAETRIMTSKNPVFMDQSYKPVGFTDSHGKATKK